jgi:hypothetical protein
MKSVFLVLLIAALAGCSGGNQSQPETVTQLAGAMHRDVAADNAVTIAGYRANYDISVTGTTVTVKNRLDGTVQTFTTSQILHFADKWTSFDIAGPAGQVYRLYQAAFNRKPDLAGLGFWIKANENGHDLLDIAGSFLASDEFKRLYGDNVPAASFVSAAYQNVLHRAGDTDGFNWWVTQVSAGADRRGVLYGFSDSAENKANLLADMTNGFDYVPFNKPGPIAPKFSSYENKEAAAQALGPQWLPPEVAGGNAVAFADFFQDGTYSMVTHTLEYIPSWDSTKLGHIKFYKRNSTGAWVDSTAALLKDDTGCLHPRKAVVADFNGDGKPDVFFACHGYDRDPFPGERQRVLLSQSDGSYKNVLLPTSCFCHSATAVDSANNGFANLVVTDNMTHGIPFFLLNQHDGTFKEDMTKIPAGLKYKAIFSIEAIDFDKRGLYDIWIGGNEPGATAGETTTAYDTAPLILRNDGQGNYPSSLIHELPTVPDYGLPLDIVFLNGKIYLLRTNIGGGPNNYGMSFYTTAAVQVIDYQSGTSSVPYVHTGSYSNGMRWVNWLIPTQNRVESMDAAYGIMLQ